MIPLGISGSSHDTTMVVELAALARILRGGVPGAGKKKPHIFRPFRDIMHMK